VAFWGVAKGGEIWYTLGYYGLALAGGSALALAWWLLKIRRSEDGRN